MKLFRAHRVNLNACSRGRPAAAFEQLEQRYLLSADLWHAVDDAFENNDSFYQAANLGTISEPRP